MGRDWSWVGAGDKKKSSNKSKKKDNVNITTSTSSTTAAAAVSGNNTTVAGCMSAVFNLFDFHHLHFPLNHHHHNLHLPNGVEAPRNSLDSTEAETEEKELPLSPIRKDGNLNLSMGIKIKTRSSSSAGGARKGTEPYSPTIKTPTLVARLMGLDLLPENYKSASSSPTPSSTSSTSSSLLRTKPQTNKHRHYFHRNSVDGGTRSLPETPRISLGRRSVDVNCYEHQRSSLHLRDINVLSEREKSDNVKSLKVKEMKKIHEDNKENRSSCSSPREYARQIVMQLKENVSRRMGTDITNTTKSRINKEQSRDLLHESKKGSKITIITHDSSSPSCSPRLGSIAIPKTRPNSPQTNNVVANPKMETKIQDKTRLQTVQEEPQGGQEQQRGLEREKQRKSKLAKKCKKPENYYNDQAKFGSRLVKPIKEEPFVRSPAASNNRSLSSTNGVVLQGDKTPLSINHLINFTSVPSLHTVKKKDSSSPHKPSNSYVDSLKLKETQARRNRAPETQQTLILPITTRTTISSANAASGELEYITRILRRTGIDKDTPISYAKWFSPSHPLDPSIFYFLEHFAITSVRPRNSPDDLSLRCNRKLLFNIVDEILSDVLKLQINLKPWVCRYSNQTHRNLRGSELIDELCLRIKRFPLAECLILEDIDALVAGDFPEMKELAFEEEGEGIVTELEKLILDTLLIETTSDYYVMGIKTTPWRDMMTSVARGVFT